MDPSDTLAPERDEGGQAVPSEAPPDPEPHPTGPITRAARVIDRRSFLRRPLRPALAAAGAVGLAACDMTSAPFDRDIHLLKRLTYGPTPAARDHIKAIGESAWLAEQLNPASLDTSDLDAKLAAYPALTMPAYLLYQTYPDVTSANYQGAFLRLATAIRVVESPAQLFERMVEFWSDHFNVDAQDRVLNLYKIVEDRTVQRTHALGRFKDLLVASAKSPAMLEYLDNARSSVGAINENYARELLELHTVGKNGGYTEADVVACARLFTGWTILAGYFAFRPERHDSGPVTIMGWTRPTSGDPFDHGVQFLHWLAEQPQTAQFVCRKLAVRFVGDQPDPGLVNAMAAAWLANDTQIPPVIQAMIGHPAFDAAAGLKFRRPFDYAAWLLRAIDARIAATTDIAQVIPIGTVLGALGQIPFSWPAPNGYPDVQGAWLNTGAMLTRWNLVGDVLANVYDVITYDASALRASLNGLTAAEIYDALAQRGLLESVTPEGRGTLNHQTGWTDSYRPTPPEITASLTEIVVGLLASADAQYR